MKITYSQIEARFRESVETDFARHVEKLNRMLKHYPPDSVQLHGSLEQTPRKAGFAFALHLTLPTGKLHATGSGADVRASAKAALPKSKRR